MIVSLAVCVPFSAYSLERAVGSVQNQNADTGIAKTYLAVMDAGLSNLKQELDDLTDKVLENEEVIKSQKNELDKHKVCNDGNAIYNASAPKADANGCVSIIVKGIDIPVCGPGTVLTSTNGVSLTCVTDSKTTVVKAKPAASNNSCTTLSSGQVVCGSRSYIRGVTR